MAVLGPLVTLGCLFSIYGEVISFGGPTRPTRTIYLAVLSLGALAGVTGPAAVCAVVLRTSWRLAATAATVVVTALAVLFLGIT